MGSVDTILTMLDRMVHESTSDIDRQQTIEGLRRKLHGALPSSLLSDNKNDTWEYQAEINALRSQLAEVTHRNNELESSLNVLAAQVRPQPVDGYYTMEQFMAALTTRLGRSYGWRVDYVQATKDTPGAVQVENAAIQQWQTKRQVPAAYYDQIECLNFKKRHGQPGQDWLPENYDHLVELYLSDPTQSNAVLAEKCSNHFGRPITENAIRGAIDRLRKCGRLPMRRPGREK